jgi:hypothetical protein
MDDELEVDPYREAIEKVIGVLTPLRQHRHASAERAQHRAQRELEAMQRQLIETQDAYVQERQKQHDLRHTLAKENLHKSMELSEVELWHEKERQMLDRLAFIQQDVNQQREQIDAQRQFLEQVRQTAKAQLRAVEKLACMSETLNED